MNPTPKNTALAPVALLDEFDRKVVEVAKKLVAKDLTNEELYLYLHCAKSSGLDPRYRQIYAIKDKSGRLSITPSIDGMRLIAARTGRYAAGPVSYEFDAQGNPVMATAITYSYNRESAQWMAIAGQAWMKGSKRETPQWNNDPMNMLGIAAERRSLKRAFPLDMTGLADDDGFGDDLGDHLRSNGPMVDTTAEPVPDPPQPLYSEGVRLARELGARAVAAGVPELPGIRKLLGMSQDPEDWTMEQFERLRAEVEKRIAAAAVMQPAPPTAPPAPPHAPSPPPVDPAAGDALGPDGAAHENRLKQIATSLGLRVQDFAGLRAGIGLGKDPGEWTAAKVAELEAAIREEAAGRSK